jgi:hypothetical protein
MNCEFWYLISYRMIEISNLLREICCPHVRINCSIYIRCREDLFSNGSYLHTVLLCWQTVAAAFCQLLLSIYRTTQYYFWKTVTFSSKKNSLLFCICFGVRQIISLTNTPQKIGSDFWCFNTLYSRKYLPSSSLEVTGFFHFLGINYVPTAALHIRDGCVNGRGHDAVWGSEQRIQSPVSCVVLRRALLQDHSENKKFL